MTCASAFPLSKCFCSRRNISASDLGAGARQSGQRSSYLSHLKAHSVQSLLQQHE
eukprot:CAMPEP_0184090884 /NCGR_PEP_ID=MMETSP0974-20121125/7455_1 /TAXON_ID=483370 /ORGANISM="non described non described, Strain CCMP2097" /LENGTH=54 /DNA_ID=CAMNT_0026393611 /DNA_START=98 /DNA_END=262 /DNA_ORIENTATION=+